MNNLSPELRAFLKRHISSAEQFDVLLLLRGSSERSWRAAEVAEALKMAPEPSAMRLFLLASAKLLSAQGSPDVHYRYEPHEGAEPFVEQLAQAYRERGAQIFEAVYDQAPDPLRSFTDAFKLKK